MFTLLATKGEPDILKSCKSHKEQYEKIAKYLPNVSMTNLQPINAILYVVENGCKWRALLESYGNWHTIYVRMNRWSKNGVLGRVFAALQTEGIIWINTEIAETVEVSGHKRK